MALVIEGVRVEFFLFFVVGVVLTGRGGSETADEKTFGLVAEGE